MQFPNRGYQKPLQDTMVSQRSLSKRDLRLNRSLQNLKIPFDWPTRLKFPKNRTCRKQTSMTMLIETEQQDPKPSLKVGYWHNMSVIFEKQNESLGVRKTRAAGAFHSLSLESRPGSVQNRSIQDIGVDKNRKRQSIFRQIVNDPILIGDSNQQSRPSKKFAQQEVRNYRDQGTRMKSYLIWQKPRQKSYLQRYQAGKQLK